MQFQLFKRDAEIKQTGQTETVDRPAAILPQIEGIRVGFQDVVLAVARINQNRHQHFVNLAFQSALVAQEQIFHQLLSERTTTLHSAPGPQVGQ